MDINRLIDKVKHRVPKPIDEERKYSVLIPLIQISGKWHIVYELRSKELRAQPGEISFPGGKVEDKETFMETAIRETMEELNISRNSIYVIGELDYLVSSANLTIHCFLGVISGLSVDKIEVNKSEVDHLFTVPLDFFLENEPEKYVLDVQTVENEEFPYYLIPNGKDYKFRIGKHQVLFYRYNDYIIWGFTAKMTHNLMEIIKSMDL